MPLLWAIRHLLGITHLEEDMDEVRAEQVRIAQELDRIKRANIADLDVTIEESRKPHWRWPE